MVANAPKISVSAKVRESATHPHREIGKLGRMMMVSTRKARKKTIPRSRPKKIDTFCRDSSTLKREVALTHLSRASLQVLLLAGSPNRSHATVLFVGETSTPEGRIERTSSDLPRP